MLCLLDTCNAIASRGAEALLSPPHYRKAAFMKLPDIILAGEPDGNLDSRMGDEVLALLKEPAARFEQAILIVTPDPRAAEMADRAVFLSYGRVVGEANDPDQEKILERIKTLEFTG
jgi:putative ABC transport system ATP-binding protein